VDCRATQDGRSSGSVSRISRAGTQSTQRTRRLALRVATLAMLTLASTSSLARAQFDSLPQAERIKREANPVPGQPLPEWARAAWLGCWSISMRDSTTWHSRTMVVRLDSIRAPTRAGPQQYSGAGVDGFDRHGGGQITVLWVAATRDSLDVSTVGLGGTGWRLATSGDSLAGIAYEFYDIVDAETILGPASARRRACP
jgi:hypothetical protein